MRTLIFAILAAFTVVSCAVDAPAGAPIVSVNLAAASVAPYISPEIALDLPISAVAGDSQNNSSVAFDGTNYMVVWQDQRSGLGSDIYAARVTATGEILDPTGIPVSVMPGDQGKPDISFDGTQYIVVWEDAGDGAAKMFKMMGSTTENDVVYTTVGTDGTVGEEVRVTPIDTVSQQRPRLACTSVGLCLIVWYSKPGAGVSYNIYGRRVTASGVVDAADIALYTGDYDQRTPDVAAKPGLFAVVWEDGRNGESDIYGLTVTTEETPTISISFPVSAASSSQQTQPAISTNGTDFMVGYEDTRSGSTDIYAAKIEADYDVTEYHVTSSVGEEQAPAIAWDGTYYLISYADTRNGGSDIYGTRIGNDGGVYDISGFFICNTSDYQTDPAIAWGSSKYLVTWTDERNGSDNEDIYGAFVTPTGGAPTVTPAGGEPISLAANGQYHPQVSLLDGTYLIVWEDHRAVDSNIYAVRVDGAGNVLDAAPIAITVEAGDQLNPVVANVGTSSWLVVWEDRSGADANIRARRVSLGGGVYSIMTINAEASDQQNPTITANGTDYFIAWEDYGAGNADILAARVTGAGALLDATALEVSVNTSAEFAPSCAYQGGRYFCVWADRRGGSNSDIYGARLDGDGALYDAVGHLVYDGPTDQNNPHVAAAAAGWMVSWENLDALNADVSGLFLDADLIPLTTDPAAYAEGEYAQRLPRAAFDGSGMVLAYQSVSLSGGYLVTSLHGAEVALDGTADASFNIAVGQNNAEEIDLALEGTTGTGLMVYQAYDPAPEYRSYRVKAVQYYRGNPGDTCDDDAQCGSGNCAGGYCCTAASCSIPGICHIVEGYQCDAGGVCIYPVAEEGAACGDPSETDCDAADTCDAVQNCVVNRVEAGITCRIAAGDCDAAELCDGINAVCPDDIKHGDETVCRDGIGLCNYAETCDGTNDDCPPDIKSTGTCRPAAGVCDTAENCDGEGNDCPEDLFVGLGTECRASAGVCDTAEGCTGDSAACPDDAKSTEICRAAAGDCDIIENCDGTGNDCPADELVASGNECRAAAGTCDAAELCTGDLAACPDDSKLTGVCRVAAGACDAVENCDGTGNDCPAEDFSAVNGNTCEDGSLLTEGDVCLDGGCAGQTIEGICDTGIAIAQLPYSANGDLHGRPSSVDTYGVGCSAATATNGDVVYVISAPVIGDVYQITVTPAAGTDIFFQIQQGDCGSQKDCIGYGDTGNAGEAESGTITVESGDPIYIVVENSGEDDGDTEGYTITVSKVEDSDEDDILQDDALTADEDGLPLDDIEPDEIADLAGDDEDDIATDESGDDTDLVKPDKDAATEGDADAKNDKDTAVQDDTVGDDDSAVNDELDDEDLLLNDLDDLKRGAHPGCNCALIL